MTKKEREYYNECKEEYIKDILSLQKVEKFTREELEEMCLCELGEIYGSFIHDDDEYYTQSSTYGDYSPSNPWDAPGMRISDFF